MYEFIKGKIIELNPAFVVIETNGIGYFVNISINTYSHLSENELCKLWLHHAVREDAETLFGFKEKPEREIFRLLISVNGVGANTARMMLSTMTSDQLISAIQKDDVGALKSIKGIGIKTAQRIIIDLRDKISENLIDNENILPTQSNTIKNEAFEALTMLGFNKKQIEKAIIRVMSNNEDLSVEKLVKLTLKQL
jgi:Holliday junction DNA helicase RuvA